MMIHEITAKVGKHKKRKRIGRGEGSGSGETAGRGHKGAGSRAGYRRRPGFEGGQMPLVRRMPKRGFSNSKFRRLYHVVNVKTLEERCDDGAAVTVESLAKAGVVRDASRPLKVLGEGELTKALTVTAEKFSASAKAKIEGAGGQVREVPRVKWMRNRDAKKAKPIKGAKKGADSVAEDSGAKESAES